MKTDEILKFLPGFKSIHMLLAAGFLFLLCGLTYGDILTHQFMIDDHGFIKNASSKVVSYGHLDDFFEKSTAQHYAPFNLLINVGLFQLFHRPLPFYLMNLALFYINVWLLFIFIKLISGDFLTALLTSIIFCVHPMTGEMLQHITLNILLVQTIFIESGLITLFLYVKYNRPVFYYFFSLLMVSMALFCHESILLFPLYAGALLYLLTGLTMTRVIKIIAPFVLLALFLFALWLLTVNPIAHIEKFKIWDPVAMANFFHVFLWYLSNLLVPHNIVFMCNMPPINGATGLWDVLFICFLFMCLWAVFFCFKRWIESFAIILFLVGFIYSFPASRAWSVSGEWVFEPNWYYFFSIGFYLFFVLMLLRLKKHINSSLFVLLLLTIFISYEACTIQLNIISKTELSYCEDWLRKFPGNEIARDLIANVYRNNKNSHIPALFIPDMLNMVDVYIKYDYPQNARELIERISTSRISVIQSNELLYKFAAVTCKSGYNDHCGDAISSIIGLKKDPSVYMHLCYEFYKTGGDQAAMRLLRQSMALFPRYKEPYLLSGVIMANDGRYQEAINWWRRGLAIDPADPRFVSNIMEAQNLRNGNAK